MNPRGLDAYSILDQVVFDCTGKPKELYKEVGVDGNFPPKQSAKESFEGIPKDYTLSNQTAFYRKNPKDPNPTKFL